MKKTLKNNIGITLIALVVTIIVLLILAGITIGTLTGDNGIISKANEAKETTNKEQAREKLSLILLDIQTTKIPKGEALIIGDELAREIGAYDEVTKATFMGDLIEVEIDGYTFEVNGDLGIEDGIEKIEPDNLNDWEYTIGDDGYATLTCYKGSDTTVVVPNYINGYRVKSIGTNEKDYTTVSLFGEAICEYIEDYDSWGNYVQNTIEEIIISDGITTIEDDAFLYAIRLKKVFIPRSVTTIGSGAFCLFSRRQENIENKLEEINLYNNIETMGSGVFCGRETLIVNIEYKEEEIPITWKSGWNSLGSWIGAERLTPNYGVIMD